MRVSDINKFIENPFIDSYKLKCELAEEFPDISFPTGVHKQHIHFHICGLCVVVQPFCLGNIATDSIMRAATADTQVQQHLVNCLAIRAVQCYAAVIHRVTTEYPQGYVVSLAVSSNLSSNENENSITPAEVATVAIKSIIEGCLESFYEDPEDFKDIVVSDSSCAYTRVVLRVN